MRPTLYENDIIIVKNYEEKDLEVNDIITFKQKNKIISHRILNIENKNNKKIFHTKGDNNELPDDFDIEEKDIYGKMLFKIPKIGGFIEYIQNEKGLIKSIVIIVIIFILFNMNENKKNKRKITRKKYEIKKIRQTYND